MCIHNHFPTLTHTINHTEAVLPTILAALGDFSNGICHASMITVTESNPIAEIVTKITQSPQRSS